MQMTMGKKVIGALMAAVLCLGMMPALALAPAGTAEAAELKAAEIQVPTANATKTATTTAKKTKVTNLTTALKNNELKIIVNTEKYVKNPAYNAKTDSDWEKYKSVSTTNYTGKAVKPSVELYLANEKSTKKYTDKTENPAYSSRTFTGYTKLNGVTITGKETKKQLAKKTKGKAFTVKYENNTALGVAQITIKGVNKYKGTLYESFTIGLAPMKSFSKKVEQPVKAAASGKKALKVSWNKVKGATGYIVSVREVVAKKNSYDNQTYYATAGVTKTMLVSSNKKSTVVKGLGSKRLYEVTVTPYAARGASSYKTSAVVYDNSEWVSGYWDTKTNSWVDGYTKYTNKRVVTNTYEQYATTVSYGSGSTLKPVKTK